MSILFAGCAQNQAKYLVNFPPLEPNAASNRLLHLVDLRPEEEKIQKKLGTNVSQISDSQFSMDKVSYLKSKLATDTIVDDVKIIKFQHILDFTFSFYKIRANAIEGAVSGIQNQYQYIS